MKIKIIKQIEKTEVVEIVFPYFYKHDLLLDHADIVIYGKIERKTHSTITLSYEPNDDEKAEIEIEHRPAESLGCYFADEHKSTPEEYLDAKRKALEIIQKL